MPYSCSAASACGERIVHLHRDAEGLQLATMSTTLELRMSGTFSLKVRPSTVTRSRPNAVAQQPAHAFLRDALAHAVVDAAAGEDHLGVIAGLLGAMRQVVRIDADAVAADQARRERQEVPFGARGGQHVGGVDAEPWKIADSSFMKRDVEIALGVLDHLGGFGDLDRRRAMDAGLDDRAIDRGDDIERARVLRRRPPW